MASSGYVLELDVTAGSLKTAARSPPDGASGGASPPPHDWSGALYADMPTCHAYLAALEAFETASRHHGVTCDAEFLALPLEQRAALSDAGYALASAGISLWRKRAASDHEGMWVGFVNGVAVAVAPSKAEAHAAASAWRHERLAANAIPWAPRSAGAILLTDSTDEGCCESTH